MKIAVAVEGNVISGHFGHCQGFQVYDIEGKEIKEQKLVENPGHKPGFLPKFLAEKGIDVIMSGGMGGSAQTLFAENNIEVVVGATGDKDQAVKNFLDGKLESTESICSDRSNSDKCEEH